MSKIIEVPKETLEWVLNCWPNGDSTANVREIVPSQVLDLRALLAAPVVERRPTGRWCISVNGDWFYGTRDECIRERAEYESTFTDLDREEAGVVLPEQIWSSPPAPVAVVLPDGMPQGNKVEGEFNRFSGGYREGWNACLDKVKELNQ